MGLIGNRLTQPMVKEKKYSVSKPFSVRVTLGIIHLQDIKIKARYKGASVTDDTTSHGSSGGGSAPAAGSAPSAPCPGQQELSHPSFIPQGGEGKSELPFPAHLSDRGRDSPVPSTGTGMAPAGTRRFTPPCAPVFMVSPYSALCSSQLIKFILPRTATALMLFLPFPSLRVAYQKLRSDLKISKKGWKLLRLMEPKHRNHGTI